MSKIITTSLLGKQGNMVKAFQEAVTDASLIAVTHADNLTDFSNALDSVTGQESLSTVSNIKDKVGTNNFEAFRSSITRETLPSDYVRQMEEQGRTLSQVMGTEGFSMSNFEGNTATVKATNMALNAKTHRQTPAAEAMYPTVSIAYEEEHLRLRVRAAGIGNYVNGASAYQSASELRPLFGLLRTGDVFKDEVLALHPVHSADPADENSVFFVDAADKAPVVANYATGDGFGRSAHNTQMLAVPGTVPNYLALCQTPGQRPWTSTDEIESNSMESETLMVKGILDGKAVTFFVDTGTMSNRTFTPISNGQHSDERALNLQIRELPGFSVKDKDGVVVGETLFADYKTAGVEPLLNITFNATFNRATNELTLNAGQVRVTALRNLTSKVVVRHSNADAGQKALLTSLSAAVSGITISSNASNTSRGNFGYRIEVYDALKDLSTHRRSPVSVKYPVDKADTNQEALDYAIEQMAVAINNQASRNAFDEASKHVDYIQSITGSGVVGNAQGSNVLPGQHYVSPIAERRTMALGDAVSTPSNEELFINITTAIANEITDIIAALNHKSGLSSIYEYSNATENEWTVIVHKNLGRFVMRQGEIRAFGHLVKVNVEETNFDSEFGRMLIIPTATSTSENINPLSGIGVCVSKENILIQGQVAREQQDYNVVMTMPSFKHHSLNVVIGELVITDANKFLEGNMFEELTKQRIINTP